MKDKQIRDGENTPLNKTHEAAAEVAEKGKGKDSPKPIQEEREKSKRGGGGEGGGGGGGGGGGEGGGGKAEQGEGEVDLKQDEAQNKDKREEDKGEGKEEDKEEEEEEEEDGEEVVREDDLVELTDMTLLLSPDGERKTSRRLGLAERNKTERTLVRRTVENMVIINALKM